MVHGFRQPQDDQEPDHRQSVLRRRADPERQDPKQKEHKGCANDPRNGFSCDLGWSAQKEPLGYAILCRSLVRHFLIDDLSSGGKG